MALFFDKSWFDQLLGTKGLTRSDLAQASGAALDDIEAMFKDQMEVPARYVHAWAILLAQSPTDIALRCGVSTSAPEPMDKSARIDLLEARIATLEQLVHALAKQLAARNPL